MISKLAFYPRYEYHVYLIIFSSSIRSNSLLKTKKKFSHTDAPFCVAHNFTPPLLKHVDLHDPIHKERRSFNWYISQIKQQFQSDSFPKHNLQLFKWIPFAVYVTNNWMSRGKTMPNASSYGMEFFFILGVLSRFNANEKIFKSNKQMRFLLKQISLLSAETFYCKFFFSLHRQMVLSLFLFIAISCVAVDTIRCAVFIDIWWNDSAKTNTQRKYHRTHCLFQNFNSFSLFSIAAFV